MERRRVAIIGAGISGLVACKYSLSKGFTPIVFESQEQVGGVWTQTLESTRLQNPKEAFQFSDLPWPSSVQEMFPHNTQMRHYIQSYAQRFGVLPHIKFNCEVISIDYQGESEEEIRSWELWGGSGKAFGSKGKWILKVKNVKDGSTEDYEAEFVVLCLGRFSGLADIPELPPGHGPEMFSGTVIHAMDFSAMDNESAAKLIKGKSVAVIGSSKSAVDIAFECGTANGTEKPCTMVQRTIHWMMPDFTPWGVNIGYLCLNRFSELMIHKPGEGLLQSILASLLSPLRWTVSKFVESSLRWKLPLKKYGMIPAQRFVDELSSCQILILPENFYDRVVEGSIILKKSKSFSFCKEGLLIDGEEPVKADIVILATGYKGDKKLKDIFASPAFGNLVGGSPTSPILLHRQMIHPRIPQLAVLGYSETISNLYSIETRCMWLSSFLDQTFALPSLKEMENEAKIWKDHMKRCSSNMYRKACIASIHIWYHDQLCKDLGCNPRRKKGFFSEWFQPYGLPDYAGLVTPPLNNCQSF